MQPLLQGVKAVDKHDLQIYFQLKHLEIMFVCISVEVWEIGSRIHAFDLDVGG